MAPCDDDDARIQHRKQAPIFVDRLTDLSIYKRRFALVSVGIFPKVGADILLPIEAKEGICLGDPAIAVAALRFVFFRYDRFDGRVAEIEQIGSRETFVTIEGLPFSFRTTMKARGRNARDQWIRTRKNRAASRLSVKVKLPSQRADTYCTPTVSTFVPPLAILPR